MTSKLRAAWVRLKTLAEKNRLRLYQQLILLALLLVVLPLSIASIIIYKVNQRALKKELNGFTQQLATAVYEDLTTEMRWQQRSAYILSNSYQRFDELTPVLSLDPQLEGLAVYGPSGERLTQAYSNYASLTPELRLPINWQPPDADKNESDKPTKARPKYYYEVATLLLPGFTSSELSLYHLRVYVPFNAVLPSGTKTEQRWLALQRPFPFLTRLLTKHRAAIGDSAYLVDAAGQLIAGPPGTQPYDKQLSVRDAQFFEELAPGVASLVKTNISQSLRQAGGSPELTELPAAPPPVLDEDDSLETVFVKIPGIEWGIILESPYHIQQNYLKKARTQAIVVILVCVAVVLLVGALYLFNLTQNFRQLIKSMKAMASGNYSRKIRLIINAATPYEVLYMADEWNRMADRIDTAWREVQKLNKELSQLDQLKSNLIDTVSHELRTPLTNIKGYVSRLLRHGEQLDPATRERNLKTVKQQADRLSRLVEDLLVIPDLENQQLRLHLEPVDLSQSLRHTLQLLGERSPHELAIAIEGGIETALTEADPDRLEQIWLNLLDNALKYSTDPERIEIHLRDGAVCWQVELVNPSEPIEAEQLHKLFDKFHRVDDSLTRTTRGSGLGLFITKNLVETMGGAIEATYQNNQFIMRLSFPKA